jgi:uncharacterized protein
MTHPHHQSSHCCATKKPRHDLLLTVTSIILVSAYIGHVLLPHVLATLPYLPMFTESIYSITNEMWWGMLLGIFFVGMLSNIPQDIVTSIFGKGGTFSGLVRAMLAGVLLDLCSHGILLVGMKLYQRGISLGQLMAFLIASPWNSISLTLILWALIGLKWMLMLLVLSMIIALVSGWIFDRLEKNGTLPSNPNRKDLPKDFLFWTAIKKEIKNINWTPLLLLRILFTGLKDARMILRWLFLGMIFAALIRTFVSPDQFELLFGPTLAGLGLTLIAATILEVCSEGSVPVAADILIRARAPGNAFAFLMTGVSTDYTEIITLREATKSWKISFFLPLVTVPQVVLIALVLNGI